MLPVPRAAIAAPCAALLAIGGCGQFRIGNSGTEPVRSTPAYASSGPSGTAPEAAPSDVPAVTPVETLPPDAAHPVIARFLARTGEVPGHGFGGTSRTRASALDVQAFATHRAIADIAPAYLRSRHLPSAAAALGRVRPIRDAASFAEARARLDEIRAAAHEEVAGLREYSDRANAGGAWELTHEVLKSMLDDLGRRAGAPDAPLADDVLDGWARILDECNDDDVPGLVEKNVVHLAVLLRTGRAPAANQRVAVKHVHPGLATYVRLLGRDLTTAEMAQVLSIDLGDTLRGRNTDVMLFAADRAVRDLAPRILESCGATAEAADLRSTPPIRTEAQLDAALERYADMTHWERNLETRHRLCIEAGSAALVDDAHAAFQAERGDYNSHPYYARNALASWRQALTSLREFGMPREATLELAMTLLRDAHAALKRMPRRRETSREPD